MSWRRKTTEVQHRMPSWPRLQTPRALVADDSEDSREMVGEILRAGGYEVLEATDGAEAVAVSLGQHPDIVVMDLCMPRMDGWEAIRRLKADPRTESIPVVALTALGWHSSAAALECAAYLVKPCLPFDLLGVLDAIMRRAAT